MKRILLVVWVIGVVAASAALAHAAEGRDRTVSPAAAALKPVEKPATAPGAAALQPAAAPAKPSKAKASDQTPAVVDSLALLERAVAKDSSKVDHLTRLGVMYLDRDRVQEAIRVFLKADQVKPNNPQTLVNLGAAYDAAGNADSAQHYYREALKLSPEDTLATCRLASSLYAKFSYSEAIDLLRELIAKNPNASCAYFTLGVAFADAGIYRDAIRMWKKVVELAPGSPEAVSAKESVEVLEKFIKTP